MEPRVSYALIGAFVLALGSAFIFITLWLAGGGPTGATRTYLVYLEESVAGLTAESTVKYQGVDVGRVSGISLDPKDPGRVRVRIEVREEAPVNRDTVASLATQGLTGLVYFIELRGGGPGSEPLRAAPGEGHPVIPSEPSLMSRLEDKALGVAARLDAVAGELEAALVGVRAALDEENRRALTETLQNAAVVAERLGRAAGLVDEHLQRVGPLLDDLSRAAAALPGLTERTARTLEDAGEAAEAVSGAARGLDRLVADVSPGLVTLTREGLPEVGPLLRDLRSLSERLDALAAELQRDPSLLFSGRARRPGPGEQR